MSYSHPQQFAFQRYEYATRDRYHDYYGVVLRENMGGFPAGSRFEAGSVRRDGAVHARADGRIYFLGRTSGEGASSYQAGRQGAQSSQWTFSADDRSSRGGSSYQAGRQGSQGSRWTFSADDRSSRGGSSYQAGRQSSRRSHGYAQDEMGQEDSYGMGMDDNNVDLDGEDQFGEEDSYSEDRLGAEDSYGPRELMGYQANGSSCSSRRCGQ
jgi:hypothetical protein